MTRLEKLPMKNSLLPVLAIAAASGWLAGCGGSARSTLAVVAPVAEPIKVTDLRPMWDTERVLHWARSKYKSP